MLVEFPRLRVVLVDDEHTPVRRLVADEHIDLIAILACRALHIAVVGWHLDLPRRAVRADAATGRAFRVLDADVEPIERDMALLIVASVLLRLARLGVDARRRGIDVAGLRNLHWLRARACAVIFRRRAGRAGARIDNASIGRFADLKGALRRRHIGDVGVRPSGRAQRARLARVWERRRSFQGAGRRIRVLTGGLRRGRSVVRRLGGCGGGRARRRARGRALPGHGRGNGRSAALGRRGSVLRAALGRRGSAGVAVLGRGGSVESADRRRLCDIGGIGDCLRDTGAGRAALAQGAARAEATSHRAA